MQAQVVNAERVAVLLRKIDQLAKHTQGLTKVKTVNMTFKRTIDKVAEDVTSVATLLEGVAHDNDLGPAPDTTTESRSRVARPVEFCRKFLDKNPEMPRKEAIAKLHAKGVNFATARTQYQKWFKEHRPV
ncbi:hypothetical protein EVB51_053 [Rhizobium phage RHph_Y17]|uniref:Uncharacterized protein n=2 Tax=Kleczkowskavirus RHEph4 TaxID=1921526 RepID=A0A7S5QXF2_9CAUD|nr:hypothetical protein EVB51_053 [Rhizobium phage RHph_Y17]QIG68989.1 hypothetical protein EVB73_053 [Rhizobium phage RHph_Y3_43]QIG69538.1 hypothetical protein EVB80_055 [Rhizobium phage RHph_I36]QIG75412.1 hypothetical protein EVC17_055 [Rhizobium phage RHph_Y1_1]QIG75962.1 hypothetical protein EVC21_055 [Rhizobium phage RHph_Y2_17_2]